MSRIAQVIRFAVFGAVVALAACQNTPGRQIDAGDHINSPEQNF